MKKNPALLSVLIVACCNAYAQIPEVSRNWVGFVQSIDASFLKREVKFKMTASIKAIGRDSLGSAEIWARAEQKDGAGKYFYQKKDSTAKKGEWNSFSVEGTLNESASKLHFGGWCWENGKYYFDKFELQIENDRGQMQKIAIRNASFETPVANNIIAEWTEGTTPLWPMRVKEFMISSSQDHTDGKISLLIEAQHIEKDSSSLIGPIKGFTPQIGTLVTMLNNLSGRVEQAVELLNEEELDHLMDEKANTIGGLIMHLAAAEAYYQVRTFENREFNEDEKKIWELPLDLGEQGRQQLTGHSVQYYLNIYKEVRKKTIAELAKRDDAWLNETIQEWGNVNKHWCWFHVMEHQSSHLGQIHLLKKRLPERKVKQEVKIEREH
jgi:hypothetical protein